MSALVVQLPQQHFQMPPRATIAELTDEGTAGLMPKQKSSDRGLAVNKPARKAPQLWTKEEHVAFLDGIHKEGKGRWRQISDHYVPSRTPSQIASHAQKYVIRSSGGCKRKSKFTALEEETMKHLQAGAEIPASVHDLMENPGTHGGARRQRGRIEKPVPQKTKARRPGRKYARMDPEIVDAAKTLIKIRDGSIADTGLMVLHSEKPTGREGWVDSSAFQQFCRN